MFRQYRIPTGQWNQNSETITKNTYFVYFLFSWDLICLHAQQHTHAFCLHIIHKLLIVGICIINTLSVLERWSIGKLVVSQRLNPLAYSQQTQVHSFNVFQTLAANIVLRGFAPNKLLILPTARIQNKMLK